MPLLDLHAHFPMHTRFPPETAQGPPPVGKELEYWAANQLLNYQAGEPRVSLKTLLAGSPGGIGSVLCDPEDEFFHDARPVPEAFEHLLAQMANVETEVAGSVTVVRNPASLRRCLENGQRFLLHCVEGAYGLGGKPDNVSVLAQRGVAYVIVAHLFFRGVASCVNAFPSLPDIIFNRINPKRNLTVGLTKLGHQIVERLFQEKVIVDITHCSERAQADIFAIAEAYPEQPIISSHNGVRGKSDYPLNLSDDAIHRIADSGGVIGVILFPHWLRQPLDRLSGADGFPLLFETIDYLNGETGGYDHIAIGSDLDGFIRPLKGCENYAETPALVAAVQKRYGNAADKMLYQNALRVLEQGWRGV